MKEIADILAGFQSLCDQGKPAALATVVSVTGSAYRRPGARMLIAADGRTWGGVSGGCLERDVARRAQAIIGGTSTLNCRYDTTDDEDLSKGVATGCRGTVELFIEPLSAATPGPIRWLSEVVRTRTPVTLATVVRAAGDSPHAPGARQAIPSCTPDIPARGSSLGALVEEQWDPEILMSRQPIMNFERPSMDVFIERMNPAPSLVIFGAGPDVVPVVSIGKSLGWHVTIVAARPALHVRERFAAADVVHVTSSDDPLEGVDLRPDDAVALMTHNYPRDRKILGTLTFQPRYLGILGPRRRTLELLADVRPAGLGFNDVHAPIGLDLGSQSPESIALAICAEIEAVLQRSGAGFLRDHDGPIHRPAGELLRLEAADDPPPPPRRGSACPI